MLSNHTGYETMIKHSDKIIHGLSTDSKEIATALHANGFISDSILHETYQLPEISQDKGRRLYTAVLGVVENYLTDTRTSLLYCNRTHACIVNY